MGVSFSAVLPGGAPPDYVVTQWEKQDWAAVNWTPPAGFKSSLRRIYEVGASVPIINTSVGPDNVNNLIIVQDSVADILVTAYEDYYDNEGFIARLASASATANQYTVEYEIPRAASDLYITKLVAGTEANIAILAADLTQARNLKQFKLVGTSLAALEDGVVKLSATDTSLASGYYGGSLRSGRPCIIGAVPPASPEPKRPLAYFEVPVVRLRLGVNDMYVPDIGFVEIDGIFRPPCTYRAILPTPKGQVSPTCIVGLLEPARPGLSMSGVLDALRAKVGARELTRDEALLRAKQIDDLLTDYDLRPLREIGVEKERALKEYLDWRERQVGARHDPLAIGAWLEEEKGW
jgi:hypothetical protein